MKIHKSIASAIACILAVLGTSIAMAEPFFASPRNGPSNEGLIFLYDVTTGTFQKTLYSTGSTGGVYGMAVGTDGFFYASLFDSDSNDNGRIVKINPVTRSASVFVPDGTGGVSSPRGLRFGPDGNLYVAADAEGKIFRFNGVTGAFIDVFADGFGISQDLAFGPDGQLYVTTSRNGIQRFDATTGAYIDQLVPPRLPPDEQLFQGLAFAPNGDLLVAGFGQGNDSVSRYNTTTGALIAEYSNFGITGVDIDVFDVAIGADEKIYVAVRKNVVEGGTDIVRLNGTTGAVEATFTNVPGIFGYGMLFVDDNCGSLSIGPAATKCYPYETTSVSVDIKPGNDSNSINPASRQKIPVAILTTDDFDALQVDPLSVEFGPSGATEVHERGHVTDIDGDGDLDLLLHFDVRGTGIECGDTEASLNGETFAGTPIIGSGTIDPVNCPRVEDTTIRVLVGDKDCFGLGGTCSDGDHYYWDLGGTGDDNRDPGEPLGTDQWGTSVPLGGPTFSIPLDLEGATPLSASLTTFTAGIDLVGATFYFNGTNIGFYVEPFGLENRARMVVFDVPVGLLTTENILTLSVPDLGLVQDGFIIDYVELQVETEATE